MDIGLVKGCGRGRLRLPQGDHPAQPATRRRRHVRLLLAAHPFFLGTVIGAIATGRVPAHATHASPAAWTNPTSVLIGFLFVGACGYLAAVYLVGEAARRGDGRLERYFARRAQAAAVVAGALSLATLAELHSSNRALYDRLTGRALPLVILAGLCGLAVLALLTTRRRAGVRLIAALGVAAVIWGWGVAQYVIAVRTPWDSGQRGVARSDRTPTDDPATYDDLAKQHPLGRVGLISDVVDGVPLSETAPFITGEVLHVDGGQIAGS
jgi:hypothetical protein